SRRTRWLPRPGHQSHWTSLSGSALPAIAAGTSVQSADDRRHVANRPHTLSEYEQSLSVALDRYSMFPLCSCERGRQLSMGASATILHADLDAFYASVEQLLAPRLRGRPIAVGGGVVLAASYEARALGVRSGMPGRRARQLCPDLVFVAGHFDEYQRLGDAAIGILSDFTPAIERISIDEAFADVAGCTHLFG